MGLEQSINSNTKSEDSKKLINKKNPVTIKMKGGNILNDDKIKILKKYQNIIDKSLSNIKLPQLNIISFPINNLFSFTPMKTMTNKKNIYNVSDIEKFLNFLNYYEKINNSDIYIVSHSHSMQTFLKSKKLSIFDQNLWSIQLNYKNNNVNYKINIIRHSFSTANLIKEKRKISSIMSWFSRKFNQLVTEMDSPLSLYGIKLALFKKNTNKINDNINIVYVSPLIRTWMTAVCLYCKNKTPLNIVISPYIIEENSILLIRTYDNTPKKFEVQIPIFKKFLNILNKLFGINLPNIVVYDGRTNTKYTFDETTLLHNSIGEIVKNCPYFIKVNTPSPPNLKFTEVNLLPGVNKPSNELLKKLSSWCEPLSISKAGYELNNCKYKKT